MDTTRVAALAARVVEAGATTAPAVLDTVKGRVLLIDGDGLAYSCAGNDDTSPGYARHRLLSRVNELIRACGAETVEMHLTTPGSNKRHRYAVATVRPYQQQRGNKQRPKNWQFLRDLLQSPGFGWTTQSWSDREADDGVAYAATLYDDPVICSADKDFRMIPGLHLDTTTLELTRLNPGDYEVVGENGKLYGFKWFLLQLLQGDTADNIPGLPFFMDGDGKRKRVGPKTAETALGTSLTFEDGLIDVVILYRGYYGEEWADRLVEQAALLWLSTAEDGTDLVPPVFLRSRTIRAAYDRLKERLHDAA